MLNKHDSLTENRKVAHRIRAAFPFLGGINYLGAWPNLKPKTIS